MIKIILQFWPILALALQGLTAWIAWSMHRLATDQVHGIVRDAVAPLVEVDQKLAREIDSHGDRLTTLEEAVKHLPTGEDVDKLTAAITSVDRNVAAQSATLVAVQEAGRATQNSVDRLYRFFLEKGA